MGRLCYAALSFTAGAAGGSVACFGGPGSLSIRKPAYAPAIVSMGPACGPESSGKTITENGYPPDAVDAGDMRDAIELSTKCARSTQWTRAGNSEAFRRMSVASRAHSGRYKSHSHCRLSRRCSRRAAPRRKYPLPLRVRFER
jgi:hypothetical protein